MMEEEKGGLRPGDVHSALKIVGARALVGLG